jgi:hypothetical protein
MEDLGVLLYGYDEAQGARIGEALSGALGCSLTVINAGTDLVVTVRGLLEGGGAEDYAVAVQPVMMFLGFDDVQVETTLRSFPKAAEITRPIFCGLTEHNIDWPLATLVEHLTEEKRYWENKQNR